MKILNENPKTQEIKNEDDWLSFCPPEGGEKHWKVDHSAKEFAKIVISNNFERDICNILQKEFGECTIDVAYPERRTNFDKFGAPRHHDLACEVNSISCNIALGFEAKATEDFDTILREHIKTLKKNNQNSKILDRVNLMVERFWGKEYSDVEHGDLYYQLLTGLTGTIFFAEEKKCKKCVFVVYQIETDLTNSECIKNHEDAICNFLKKFKSDTEALEQDKIYKLGNFKANTEEIETYLLYIKRKKI